MDDQSHDEIIDIPTSRVEQVKTFLVKNSTPIAIGATSALAFMVGRKTGLFELERVKNSVKYVESELNATAIENGTMWKFIDHKKLGAAYVKYAEEHGLLS